MQLAPLCLCFSYPCGSLRATVQGHRRLAEARQRTVHALASRNAVDSSLPATSSTTFGVKSETLFAYRTRGGTERAGMARVRRGARRCVNNLLLLLVRPAPWGTEPSVRTVFATRQSYFQGDVGSVILKYIQITYKAILQDSPLGCTPHSL